MTRRLQNRARLLRPLACVLLAAALLVAAAPPASAQISIFGLRNALIDFLLEQLGTPGAFELTVDAVEDPEDGGTSLVGFKVSDEEGVWLSADRITFDFNGPRLLSGALEIERLEIVGLDMRRLPTQPEDPSLEAQLRAAAAAAAADAGDAPVPFSAYQFDWPRSPITLRVDGFRMVDARISDRVLPQAIVFSADGAARDEGDEQSVRLNLRREDAVEGRIDIAYTSRFEAGTLAFEVVADEAPGGLVAEIAGLAPDAGSRLTLRADGPPSDWALTLSAGSDGLFDAQGSGSVAYADRLSADFDVALTPGPGLSPEIAAALGPEASLTLSLREDASAIVRIEAGRLATRDVAATLTGFYDRSDGSMAFDLDADADGALSDALPGTRFDRATFAGRLEGRPGDLRAEGRFALDAVTTDAADLARLEATGDAALQGDALSFSLDGQARGVRLGPLGPDVIGPARVGLAGTATASRLALDRFAIDSAPLFLSLSGAADLTPAPGAADFLFFAETRDLARVAAAFGQDAAGDLRAEGALVGPLDALSFDGAVSFDRLVLRPPGGPERRFADGRISARLDLGGALGGPIEARLGASPIGPVSARFALGLEGDRARLDRLAADAAGVSVSGDAALNLSTGLAEADLAFAAPSLRPLGRAAGLELSGAASGRLRLFENGRAQGAEVSAAARDLATSGVRVGALDGRARVADVAAGAGLDANARLTALSLGLGAPFDAALSATGELSNLAISAAGEGGSLRVRDRERPLAFDLAGRLNASGPETALTLDRGLVGVGAERLRLLAPTRLSSGPRGLAIEGLDLLAPGDGRIQLDLRRTPSGALIGSVEAERIDLTLARDYAGAPIAGGLLDASGEIDSRPGVATGRFRARAEGVRPDFEAEVAPLFVTVRGDWAEGRLEAMARGAGAFEQPIAGTLSLPLVAGRGGALSVPRSGALGGGLVWSGDLSELWALTPPSDHLLSGAAGIDVALDGTVGAPEIAGGLTIADGRYDNLALGTILTGITATSRVVDQGAGVAVDVVATDGAEGRLEGSALARLGPPLSLESDLTLTEAVLVRRPDARARLSGAIDAGGPLTALRVGGAITVDAALVDLSEVGGDGGFVDLGEVVFTGMGAPPPEVAEAAEPSTVALDLTVTAPGDIFVRGRGLESEWAMDLAVGGVARAPIVTGSIERLSGALDLLGARFDFPRGRVVFDGPLDPALDIVFARRDNDIEGRIEVFGRASDPQIGFASTPSVPDEEVLPRTLFGRSRQALSPSEAAQLAAGVATLLTGSGGVAGLLTGALGVDAGVGGLTAGRYVGDGVFVGAEQSYDGSSGSVVVELEVFDGVSVDAEVDQDGGASVGGGFRLDF